MSPRPASAVLQWVVLAAMTASWGSAFAALRIAVAEIHPAWNTALRLAIATAVLGLVMVARRKRLPPLWPRPHGAWGPYAVSGVAGMALPFLLFAYASQELPSAVTAICNGATPIFVALLAHFLSAGERLTARRVVGVTLGFGGLVLLVGGGELRNVDPAHTAAVLAALAGAALYAVSGVSIRRAPPVDALTGALLVCLTGLVVALPAALVIGGPPSLNVSSAAVASVLFLGIGPTAVAMIAWVWLTHQRGALFASMGTYVAPLFATAIGVTFMNERLPPEAFVALALVVAGMVVASRRSPAPSEPDTIVAAPARPD